jgi:DNA-binding response OmpR family regulator
VRGVKGGARESQLPFVVIGHEDHVERPDGAAPQLAQLGAPVLRMLLWEGLEDAESVDGRLFVFDAGERIDHAQLALATLRRFEHLREVPTLVVVAERRVADLRPEAGFGDFLVSPYFPTELYARIRALEWKASEFSSAERLKIGGMVIDAEGHEVTVDGRRVALKKREYELLVYFARNRGRLLSREQLLRSVWGSNYEGSDRTIDVHVRRLRAKLGPAFSVETVHREGYKFAEIGRSRSGASRLEKRP